jgi:hypothetical protein
MNERGQYVDHDARDTRRGSGWGGAVVLLGITAAIYALSPGARYWYKHGRLPPGR